jgi:hypothetical protein
MNGVVIGKAERRVRYSYGEYGTYYRAGWEYRPRGSQNGRGTDEFTAIVFGTVIFTSLILLTLSIAR